jgi:hypothetical protein
MDPEQMTRPPTLSPSAPSSIEERMEKLSGSARGWHTVQMAVLGFVGICGVLHTADTTVPQGIQLVAAVLAAGAFVLGLVGVLTVGRVAYPIEPVRTEAELLHRLALLRGGIRTTVVALALVVVAALAGWWPHSSDAGTSASASVAVSDTFGRTWCGTLTTGPDNAVSLQTAGGTVAVPSNTIAAIATVATCE